MPTWTNYSDIRYTARGFPPRAIVEQFAEEMFGHPTAWVWRDLLCWTFQVATDPRVFRLRLMGEIGAEVFLIQVREV